MLEGWSPLPIRPGHVPALCHRPYLAIATFAQDTQQLEAVGANALGTIVNTALRDLNLFVVPHGPGGDGTALSRGRREGSCRELGWEAGRERG